MTSRAISARPSLTISFSGATSPSMLNTPSVAINLELRPYLSMNRQSVKPGPYLNMNRRSALTHGPGCNGVPIIVIQCTYCHTRRQSVLPVKPWWAVVYWCSVSELSALALSPWSAVVHRCIPNNQLGQPDLISRSGQHFGLDCLVGLIRMGKLTPDINPKLASNPEFTIESVVWAK